MPGTRQATAVDTNCGGLSMFRGCWALTSADGAPGSAQRAVQQPHRDPLWIGVEARRHDQHLPECFSSLRRLVANLLVGRRNSTPQHMKQEHPHGNSDGQS